MCAKKIDLEDDELPEIEISWYQQEFFKYAVGTLLVLIIMLLLYQLGPFFAIFLNFVAAIIFPILLASLLYYVLRPLVDLLERFKLPRYLAIACIYIVLGVAFVIVNLNVVPFIIEQVQEFTNLPTEKIEVVREKTINFMDMLNVNVYSIQGLREFLSSYLQKINAMLSDFAVGFLSSLASLAIALALTPFILFYFLKDDRLFPIHILRYVPTEYQEEANKILKDIDLTLSNFIVGQMTVAGVVGLLLYIGYLIIGLNHALILAIFATIFYAIPFLGMFIAIIPALIVGLANSPFMTLKVVIVMIVVHALEANLLSPYILGQKLHVHPLTLILLLLAAGSLYGIIGLLLATPAYAIAKVVVWNLYKIYRLRRLKTARRRNDISQYS